MWNEYIMSVNYFDDKKIKHQELIEKNDKEKSIRKCRK